MINRYASLKQGLVGAWCPSLGASGFRLIDRSGNNNHGVLTGMDPGTDWVPSGGKLALDFDGVNDYVVAGGNSIGSIGTGDFAVSMWVRPTSFSSGTGLFDTCAVLGPGARPKAFIIAVTATTGKLYLFSRDNVAPIIGATATSNNSLVLSAWNHVGLVRNRGITTYFINGVADSVTLSNFDTDLTSPWAVFGRYADVNSGWFPGQLDDVRLYSRALTPSEIRLLYTGGRGVGLAPERIKHRRKTTAAATNRRRRIICGANC